MLKIQKNKLSKILPLLIVVTLVIFVRELAVYICAHFGFAQAGNIVGMMMMFVLLMCWKLYSGLPSWMIESSNKLLGDSGFAFLPVSAGAGILLFGLGDELIRFLLVTIISTLVPLWFIAKVANFWLKDSHLSGSKVDE